MKFLTRDILSFYKEEKADTWYLKKYFSNTKEVGLYQPFRKDVVATRYNKKDNSIETIDEHNTYKINSIGCRGEVYENSDTLALGCSLTFGLGVPELGRWPNFLSKKINKSMTNLGSPGDSVHNICINAIQYCLNTKMPKEIFCLFPDFFRSKVVVDKEFYKSKVNRGDIGKKDGLDHIFCNPTIIKDKNSFFMEVEDKNYIEDSTSPHQLILNSVNYIYMLESFCLSNNIKLYWTTWHGPTSFILQELSKLENFKLKNFTSFYPADFNLQYDGIGGFVNNRCNMNTHEHEFKDHVSWAHGSDYAFIDGEKTLKNSHPGIHVQEHISEFFYNLYKERNENN
jgi:hypothetical protein